MVRFNATTLWHSDAAEWAPSTASNSTHLRCPRDFRLSPDCGKPDVALIDLRERTERERHGTIPGSLHVPYPSLLENISEGGMPHELAKSTSKRLLFYCAFGERSAMAVQAAQDAGLASARHIQGGIDAWKKASGPLVHWTEGAWAALMCDVARLSAVVRCADTASAPSSLADRVSLLPRR